MSDNRTSTERAVGAATVVWAVLACIVGVPIVWFGGYFALSLFVSPNTAAIAISVVVVLVAAVIIGAAARGATGQGTDEQPR